MGGYISYYTYGSAPNGTAVEPTAERKTVIIEPAKLKEPSMSDSVVLEPVVSNLSTQIIEEHVKKSGVEVKLPVEVVTKIVEAPQPIEAKQPIEVKLPVEVEEKKQIEPIVPVAPVAPIAPVTPVAPIEKAQEEPAKKVEIEPVAVSTEADVVKKNKKKRKSKTTTEA